MIKRPLFRRIALERFLGPLPTDAPLCLTPLRLRLLWLAVGLLSLSAFLWLA